MKAKQIYEVKFLVAVVLFLVAIRGPVFARPPRVIEAVPANGEVNIDPQLQQIRIVFDQDMSMTGYSVCGGGPRFPNIIGRPGWLDRRTFVMKVQLEADHVYEFDINCPSAQNFKNLRGESAEIYPIRFKTGSGSVTGGDEAGKSPIETLSAGKNDRDAASKTSFITFSNIDKAWSYSQGENTKVAVLDWLFDMSDEASSKYVNPISLVPNQKIGFGKPWHGEWMAQIVHQVAPKAKIIPIRARPVSDNEQDADGRNIYEKYLVEGIRFAADQGVVAVTNSMGPVTQCEELQAAIDYAEQKGTIFVNVHPELKAKEYDKRIIHSGIVSVPRHPASPEPYRDIYVWPYQENPVYKDGWGYSNGPPIVAGVIALMKSANPKLTPEQIRSIIYKTARMQNGFRVLDADAALKICKNGSDAVADTAKQWLRLIDDGDYAGSWEQTCQLFKSKVSKEQLAQSLGMVRKPLGKMISRQVMSTKQTEMMPGIGPGEYVIIQFKTSFENKKDVVETVTPMLDEGSVWRVSGYYIK